MKITGKWKKSFLKMKKPKKSPLNQKIFKDFNYLEHKPTNPTAKLDNGSEGDSKPSYANVLKRNIINHTQTTPQTELTRVQLYKNKSFSPIHTRRNRSR